MRYRNAEGSEDNLALHFALIGFSVFGGFGVYCLHVLELPTYWTFDPRVVAPDPQLKVMFDARFRVGECPDGDLVNHSRRFVLIDIDAKNFPIPRLEKPV